MKILALRFNKLPCFLARIGTSRAGLLFSVGSSLMALQNRVREKNVILTTPNWPKRTWYTNIYPGRQPLASFKQARPAVSSSLLLTCFSATCFNGMAVESQLFGTRACLNLWLLWWQKLERLLLLRPIIRHGRHTFPGMCFVASPSGVFLWDDSSLSHSWVRTSVWLLALWKVRFLTHCHLKTIKDILLSSLSFR